MCWLGGFMGLGTLARLAAICLAVAMNIHIVRHERGEVVQIWGKTLNTQGRFRDFRE